MTDRNNLHYWFPRLVDAGLSHLCPKTIMVEGDVEFFALLDGQMPEGFNAFIAGLADAGAIVAGGKDKPFFLRTGHTSGKHRWKDTCFVADPGQLARHVCNLVEHSELVDMPGLPTDAWAVRELLPTKPIVTLPKYGDMPVCREWRFFIRDGAIQCHHPYWPTNAIVEGTAEYDYSENFSVSSEVQVLCHDLQRQPPLFAAWLDIVRQVGKAFPDGYWSVDLLETDNGPMLIDMAEGERSWHWPDGEYDPARCQFGT